MTMSITISDAEDNAAFQITECKRAYCGSCNLYFQQSECNMSKVKTYSPTQLTSFPLHLPSSVQVRCTEPASRKPSLQENVTTVPSNGLLSFLAPLEGVLTRPQLITATNVVYCQSMSQFYKVEY